MVEYSTIIKVNQGEVFVNTNEIVIYDVCKIGFNSEYLSIDCFNSDDKLITSIYYKRVNNVYCEDYETDKTINLAENGEIIYKQENEDEMIKEWIAYAQSNQYAPIQNMNKILNCIYNNNDVMEIYYAEIVECLIDYIKMLAKDEYDKESLVKFIKNDEEFQEFREKQAKKMTIQEYIENESPFKEFNSKLLKGYDYWGESLYDFKLNKDDWWDIFAYMHEGIQNISQEDAEDAYIVAINDEEFYCTYLIEDYTIPSINEVLKKNQYEPINIKNKILNDIILKNR